MKENEEKRGIIILIFLFLVMCFIYAGLRYYSGKNSQVTAQSEVNKKGISKAGWQKEDSVWKYYSQGHLVFGLKEIDGNLYDFDQNGRMKEGFLKEGAVCYYFTPDESGKAAAICDKQKDIKGKKYYFSKQGRGYLSTQNNDVDKLVADLLDSADFTMAKDKNDMLEICYRSLLQRCSYLGIGSPSFRDGWEYAGAYNMLTDFQGNCYSYATACAMVARALGYDAKIQVGSCKRKEKNDSEHCWVLIDGKYVLDGVYDDTLNKGYGKLQYFWKTYQQLKNEQCSYTEKAEY